MLDRADATDGDLCRAIAAREPATAEAAEGELYRRYASRVRLYGLRHLRDEEAARDLAQEVLLLVIEKLRGGAVREHDRIGSFILGTSRLLAQTQRRTEQRRERLSARHLPAAVLDPGDTGDRVDLDRIETCLERLSGRERLVVLLTFYAEQSSDVVARTVGTSPGNVRVIRHRAIDHLRDCVTRHRRASDDLAV